jgi:glycosyltransferase involved in cell wall biosynthesis
LRARWRPAPFEIVYVNDGSSDGTAAELRTLAKQYPFLRHVDHAVSCGQSAAVRSGVAFARAGVVVTLDGDGQNDPAFLPALVAAIEHDPGIGLVAGQRVGRQATGFKSCNRASPIRCATWCCATAPRHRMRPQAVRRDVFPALPYFDGLHRFLPALVRREGYDIAYVDVVDRPRLHGASNYGLWDRLWVGILDLMGVWWLIRRKNVPQVSEVARDAG